MSCSVACLLYYLDVSLCLEDVVVPFLVPLSWSLGGLARMIAVSVVLVALVYRMSVVAMY